MAMKAEWDQGVSIWVDGLSLTISNILLSSFLQCKERGTDLETLAKKETEEASSSAKKARKRTNFAPPSGTARLTAQNLKKMEVANAMELKNDVVFADVHTSKFPKGARFKQPDVDDR